MCTCSNCTPTVVNPTVAYNGTLYNSGTPLILAASAPNAQFAPISLATLAAGLTAGTNGWSPIFAIVLSNGTTEGTGNFRILKFISWTGGTGAAPVAPSAPNIYLTATGYGPIASATDIRGSAGGTGAAGNYVYIAYANDNIGTGFSNTYNASFNYIAILNTPTVLSPPVQANFAGLWSQYKGYVPSIVNLPSTLPIIIKDSTGDIVTQTATLNKSISSASLTGNNKIDFNINIANLTFVNPSNTIYIQFQTPFAFNPYGGVGISVLGGSGYLIGALDTIGGNQIPASFFWNETNNVTTYPNTIFISRNTLVTPASLISWGSLIFQGTVYK